MQRADPRAVRRINTATALLTLRSRGPATMAELVDRTGVSRRTLEVILPRLVELGWVRKEPVPTNGEVGRPAVSYGFDQAAGCVLGIDLQVGHTAVRVADLLGATVCDARVELGAETSREDRLQSILDTVREALAGVGGSQGAVLAATVSTPGVVRDDGTVDLPLSIRDWTGVNIHEALRLLLECPIHVENDAKLAAVGELAAGGVERGADFVRIHALGAWIGLGIIIDGALHRGLDGAAGEIVWAAEALGLDALEGHVLTAINDPWDPRHREATDIVRRARSGDPSALAVVDDLGQRLVPLISALGWILAPEAIVLGGEFAALNGMLVPALGRALEAVPNVAPSRLLESGLGDEAPMVGAIRSSLEVVEARLGDIEVDLGRAPV